jgi:DNA primase
LEEATSLYEQSLQLAIPFLEARGIPEETARRFRLGVVNTPYSDLHNGYAGRLAIPYLSPSGVTTLRFRSLGDDKPKYLGMPKVQPGIYNVGALSHPADSIVICEGEPDTWVMDDLVGIPAVGIPGANLWKPVYNLLFQHYRIVYVLGDGDEAGRLMAQELCAELENAVAVQLPDGLDVNDLYSEAGPMALASLVGRK